MNTASVRNRRIRTALLELLKTEYPGALDLKALRFALDSLGYPLPEGDLRAHLRYLEEKDYLAVGNPEGVRLQPLLRVPDGQGLGPTGRTHGKREHRTVSPPASRSAIEDQAIRALKRRKLQYERYFKNRDSQDGMDNQAQAAYISIIKTLVELTRKSSDTSSDPEEWKRQAQEILRRDYGITP